MTGLTRFVRGKLRTVCCMNIINNLAMVKVNSKFVSLSDIAQSSVTCHTVDFMCGIPG